MKPYSPATLPSITGVVILDLRGLAADHAGESLRGSPSPPSLVLEGDPARRIADLWRGLPPGRQARCHIPPFALHFRSGDQTLCRASICWKCHNIHGDTGGGPLLYEFDADHPTSLALLDEIRRALGQPE